LSYEKTVAMNQEEAFLQAIREDPDDDTVRLIFADWLEERGDPRGEFIRVQMELARLPEDDPRRRPLQGRSEALLRQHEPRWVGSLSSRVTGYVFRRGFVEEITLSAAAFITHARELFRLHPIRTVRVFSLALLPDTPSYPGQHAVSDFFQLPYLDRVAALHLSNENLGVRQVRGLAETSRLAGLRLLDLTNTGMTVADVQVLAASSHLTGLTTLLLNRNPLDSLGVQALAGSALAAHLTRLELDQTRLANSGARALLESPHLTRLTRLSLRGNDVSAPLQEALLARFGRQVCLL
jgi:uncharacterized protein (TIGR02996 family)